MKKHLSVSEYTCRNYSILIKRVTGMILLSILFSHVSLAQGPAELWRQKYGGSGYEFSKSGIPTSDGGFLIAGSSDSDISGEKSEAGVGDWDFWIVKVDKNGTKQWDKTFGGTLEDRLTDIISVRGGYLLIGNSQSGIGGNKSQKGRGLNDFWVVKISSDGTKIWDKTFGGSGDDMISSAITTSDGGYLLGGYSNSPKDGDKSVSARNSSNDYWVIKINGNGGKVWDKTFGGYTDDYLVGITSCSKGYILTGHSNSKKGYEKSQDSKAYPQNSSDYKSFDHWLIQINKDGKKLWDKTFGTDKDEKVYAVQKATDGGLILAGTREFIFTLDEYTRIPYDNLLVTKVNTLGAKQWEKQYDPTPNDLEDIEVFSVCSNASGFNVLYSTQYGTDFTYVSKYNWSGASQFHKMVFEDFTHFPTFLKINTTGELFLGFWKSIDEAPDYGLLKFQGEASATSASKKNQIVNNAISSTVELASELPSEFVAYPNPIQNDLNIRLPFEATGEVNVVLFNLTGRVFYSAKLNLQNERDFQLNLPSSALNPGVYTLKISSPSFNKVIQLNKD